MRDPFLDFQMIQKWIVCQRCMRMENVDGDTDGIGREVWRVWLRKVVGDHGGPKVVANLADVPLQTLNNYLHNRTRKPNYEYIKRIAAACGVPMFSLEGQPGTSETGSKGLSEDVAVYDGPSIAVPDRAPVDHGRWIVRSRALELAGILPGDVIEFDFGGRPRAGEPVVAQLYDDETGTARTVLRLFHPPYLMVHTLDEMVSPTPIQIDASGTKVQVRGAFYRLIRGR